ncbi:class I SAM-dependent methyltransferase [Dactylosporangium sp. NPDC000244]|uniref:class I SAM-dependent methyltransferase n=1 Tax=Dactylosporangium sp. NPDC000244 TaxID=3154365 RepID=UPI003318F7EB
MTILDSTRAVLADAVIDGNRLRLVGQLDRSEYARVNKVLEGLGGKWNRKAGAHVFASDPTDALAAILGGAKVPGPARTEEGFVATPVALAAEIVRDHTRIADLSAGSHVLEPSAGTGAFVNAVRAANRGVKISAVEPNEARARTISVDELMTLWLMTFERFTDDGHAPFDAIVMNPPFAVPGSPTLWIDHVRLAWNLLAPGGRLTAIVPASLGFRKDRRHEEMRALVAEFGGSAELPVGAFASQGTGVHTMVLWLDRPVNA